jgi:hypothetical protein
MPNAECRMPKNVYFLASDSWWKVATHLSPFFVQIVET